PGTRVIGVDFSESMIESGKRKIANTRYHEQIELRACDVNYLPFADGTFDGAIIAFGIRNLPDYAGGIREMTRVVKENGRVVILEFTPCCFDGSGHAGIFKRPFRLYLTKILPFMGGILSGRRDAYRYLSESIRDFPDPERLKEIMLEACLSNVEYRLLTFATVAVHVGTKIISSECG
ncbi:MAG: class I SAM-dependent methyltransferase, partial [Deltaproteobacteria bacterium]|nr:class I SAM-dependent methyltransferase [Deltaproteobacteria bacterium]